MAIAILRGNDRTFKLTVKDSTGTAVDITGYTIEFQVKLLLDDLDPPLISKSVSSGITILTQTGSTLGQATIELTPSDTANLETKPHVFDVVVVDGNSKRFHVVAPDKFDVLGVVNQSS